MGLGGYGFGGNVNITVNYAGLAGPITRAQAIRDRQYTIRAEQYVQRVQMRIGRDNERARQEIVQRRLQREQEKIDRSNKASAEWDEYMRKRNAERAARKAAAK